MRNIIIVILAVLGIIVGGALLLNRDISSIPNSENATSSYNPPQSELSETYEHSSGVLNFRYPSGWTVTEENEDPLYRVIIKSPNNFTIEAFYGPSGVGGRCEDDPNRIVREENVEVIGRNFKIFTVGNMSQNIATHSYLYDQDIPCNNIPFMIVPEILGRPEGLARVEMYFGERDETSEDKFFSADYELGKEILQSVEIKL